MDYDNIEAGVLADGLGTLAAGLIGTVGLNTYSASVGLAVATEVLSRRVARLGIGWILLAVLPGSSTLVLAIPQSVLGAALLFASAFIVLSGVSILGQRLLDARRTVTVGLGFLLGISFDELPAFYQQSLPPVVQSIVGSSLVLGLLTALALNAVFQIGARKSTRLAWAPESGFEPMKQFLLESGGLAGARTDAIRRLVQLAEEFNEAASDPGDRPLDRDLDPFRRICAGGRLPLGRRAADAGATPQPRRGCRRGCGGPWGRAGADEPHGGPAGAAQAAGWPA